MTLSDKEIIAIRQWLDVIDPITDYTKPWADALRFARAIESCAHMQPTRDTKE